MITRHSIIKCLVIGSIATFICVAVVTYFCRGMAFERHRGEVIRHETIKMMLKWYILDSGGNWPPSLESLKAKGYVGDAEDSRNYYIPAKNIIYVSEKESYCSILKVPRRLVDRINYGVSLDDLEIRDNVLLSKKSKNAVYLVEFGGRRNMGNMRESVHLFIYAQKIKAEEKSRKLPIVVPNGK